MPHANFGGESDPRFPERDNPHDGVFDIRGQTTIIFVTVRTRNREPWLANESAHATLRAVWLCSRAWMVGRYVVMPDHVHFFASPGESEMEVEAWLKYWKSMVSRAMGTQSGKWQSRGMHHRLRDGKSCQEKWEYILDNPVAAGLVEEPQAWPYQGEIFELTWRGSV